MQDPQLTHHIQLTILRQMLTQPTARYSDLKPKNLEANLFMYHLKLLIKQDLIEKQDKHYGLTRRGKRFADRATLDDMRIRIQPKLVAITALKRADGKWLLLERKHQPFLHHKGFPSGKIRFGESLQQAATRELQDKSGLTDVPLTLRGNIVMRFMDEQEVVNHIVGYVFYGEVPAHVEVDFHQEHYHAYMADEAEFFREPCFKGHQQILDYLSRGTFPFIEETAYQSDY